MAQIFLTSDTHFNRSVHVYNMYSHTHRTNNWNPDYPFAYHVGVDSHDLMPITVEDAMKDLIRYATDIRE